MKKKMRVSQGVGGGGGGERQSVKILARPSREQLFLIGTTFIRIDPVKLFYQSKIERRYLES